MFANVDEMQHQFTQVRLHVHVQVSRAPTRHTVSTHADFDGLCVFVGHKLVVNDAVVAHHQTHVGHVARRAPPWRRAARQRHLTSVAVEWRAVTVHDGVLRQTTCSLRR